MAFILLQVASIVVAPSLIPLTTPSLVTVAISLFLETYVTVLSVVFSGTIFAVKVNSWPTEIVFSVGVKDIEVAKAIDFGLILI